MVKKKRLLSQSQKMRTSMKMAVVIGVGSVTGLVALLLIVFNISKREVSHAATAKPMEFVNAEAFQDTSSALRGSINKPVIGVVVETRGSTNPITLSSFTFTMNGTTRPIGKNVANARLWYTNKENKYVNAAQVGATITPLPEGEFKVETYRELQPGKNFFWLTVDVKTTATINGSVDAEVLSLNIGSNTFLPLVSAPLGEKQIRNNSAYFSTGSSKDIAKPESWNSQRDGKGVAPTNMHDSKSCFFIQAGHTVYVSEAASMPVIQIENKGKLAVNENTRISELNIADGGTFQFDVAANDCACINKLVMDNGANYIHNSTGIFAASSAVLSKASTVIFNQYDEKTFARNIKWGNVVIDTDNSLHVNILGSFKNVQGDLEIKSTAGNALYVEGTDVINVNGNFIVSGGIFEGVRGNNSKLTLNIGSDFIVKGGDVQDVQNSYTSNAGTVINVNGNVLFASGNIALNNAQNAKSELNLVGKDNMAVYWSQKSKADVLLGNVNIKPGKEVYLCGDKLGDIGKGKSCIVEANAKLMCSKFPVTGEGRFVLNDRATIAIGNAKGINSKGNEGNILTEERFFNSGANYIYYSSSSPQRTGDFSTSPDNGAIRNLIVRKDSKNQTVVLSKDFYISEQITIGTGDINKSNFRLDVSDEGTTAVR